MPNELEIGELLLPILDHLLIEHPLPWKVDRHWTWEVIASDKTVIAKCMDSEEAQAIVSFAEKRRAQLDKEIKEVNRLFSSVEAKKGA